MRAKLFILSPPVLLPMFVRAESFLAPFQNTAPVTSWYGPRIHPTDGGYKKPYDAVVDSIGPA
jgi:hypothetical protein